MSTAVIAPPWFTGQDAGTKGRRPDPDWQDRANTQRRRDAEEAAAWAAEIHAMSCTADLEMFDDQDREDIDYAAINEYWLDVAAEAGDPDALERQQELADFREAARHRGLADLGLRPTRKLRLQNHVVDEPDPHDALDLDDFVGVHMLEQSSPYYR